MDDTKEISRASVSGSEGDSNQFIPKKLIGMMNFREENQKCWIYEGDTISIGRDPEYCQFVLQNQVSNAA